MKKKFLSLALVTAMICAMLPQISTRVNAASTYSINGVSVHYADYASSPDECWVYANNFYKKIWGVNFTNSFSESSNLLRNLADTDLTLTVDHLKTYVSNAALGSCLRICNSEYLHGTDGWGHSQIIVQKDSNGFTVFEGGLSASPYCREKYYTWSEYINTGWLGGTYAYIKYIKWPSAPAYSNCNHNYNNLGICTSTCKGEYNWQATYDTSCASIYKVSLSGGIYLRTDKPYSASTAKSDLIKNGTEVKVLGGVTNHYETDNKWYKVSYNGIEGYTNANNLTWASYGNQVITCALSSPAEGATVPKAAYPVIGTVTSKYPLQEVIAYIDGRKYATVTLGNATSLDIRPSDINQLLDFAALESGNHTIVIKARDIYHSTLLTVCTRKFITEGAVACEHAYTGTTTKSATCLEDGIYTYTCSMCGESYAEPILATGYHSWGAWGVTKEANCTSSGTETRKCYVCGGLETQTIAKTEHNYVGRVTAEAYCGGSGTKTYTCSECGTSYTETIAATGMHSYTSEIIREESCLTTGIRQYICSQCFYNYTESIPATGHDFRDGYCTRCDVADPAAQPMSGTCGENLEWYLDSEGILTVFGTGPMLDWTSDEDVPWYGRKYSIKLVVIEDGVTSIGDYAFSHCENMTNVSIPESITVIGDCAFRSCYCLTSVEFPAGTSVIGDSAFLLCEALNSVTISEGVVAIGSSVFSNCYSLTSVRIPASVTSIGEFAFFCCSNLTGIWVDAENASYSSDERGVLFNKNKTILIQAPRGISGSYIIPNGVTRIGDSAFTYSRLISVTLPSGVTSIDDDAFRGCYDLVSVTIPASVTSIGEYAFDYCNSLTDVYYDGTKTKWSKISIGVDNTDLTDAQIHYAEIVVSGTCGENLTWELDNRGTLTISGTGRMENYDYGDAPWSGFWFDYRFVKIVVEEGVTHIGSCAFFDCETVEEVVLPAVSSSDSGSSVVFCLVRAHARSAAR